MNEPIHLNNKALRDAVSEAAPDVARFKVRLDAISRDIKSLEKWLQDCGLCVTVTASVCDSGDVLDAGGFGSFRRDIESLEWGEHEGRWRLLHVCERGYGDIDCDFPGASDWEIISRKPLIETPAGTRMKCDEFLAAFVGKVASLMPANDEREPLRLNN